MLCPLRDGGQAVLPMQDSVPEPQVVAVGVQHRRLALAMQAPVHVPPVPLTRHVGGQATLAVQSPVLVPLPGPLSGHVRGVIAVPVDPALPGPHHHVLGLRRGQVSVPVGHPVPAPHFCTGARAHHRRSARVPVQQALLGPVHGAGRNDRGFVIQPVQAAVHPPLPARHPVGCVCHPPLHVRGLVSLPVGNPGGVHPQLA